MTLQKIDPKDLEKVTGGDEVIIYPDDPTEPKIYPGEDPTEPKIYPGEPSGG